VLAALIPAGRVLPLCCQLVTLVTLVTLSAAIATRARTCIK